VPEEGAGAEIDIEAAGPGDLEAVAALWTEAYVTLGDGSRTVPYRSEEAADSARDGALFVARNGSRIVGAVGLYLPGDAGGAVRAPDEAEISRLAGGRECPAARHCPVSALALPRTCDRERGEGAGALVSALPGRGAQAL
jgi:hypothetical protein